VIVFEVKSIFDNRLLLKQYVVQMNNKTMKKYDGTPLPKASATPPI